jgi:hypothetical protein
MTKNRFKINQEDIKELIPPMGFCLVSDKITVDGMKIGFMYREKPGEESDSGWRFLSGTETEEYIEDPKNSMMFEVNIVANYDPDIIPYLNSRVGTELEREEGSNRFIPLED